MSTLTRTADKDGDVERLYVIDETGAAVEFRHHGMSVTDLWFHSPVDNGGDGFQWCSLSGKPCWGDAAGRKPREAVRRAWATGGDDAAFAELDALWHREFGGQS